MYPVSDAYVAAYTGRQFQIATRLDICTQAGMVLATVPISTMQVTLSRTAAQRGTFTATASLQDYSLVPTSMSSTVAPNGAECRPYFGITFPDGSTELVPLGVFVLTDVVLNDTPADLIMTLTGSDRSWGVSQRGFLLPFSVDGVSSLQSIVQNILTLSQPNLPPLKMVGSNILPPAASFQQGSDPWAAILSLCGGGGFEAYFDRFGVPVVKPTPDPGQQPIVWNFAEGQVGTFAGVGTPGLITANQRTLTRKGVANDFYVSSSSSAVTPPVMGEEADTDPTSPTFIEGQFGDIPSFQQNSNVASLAAAQASASNQLTQSLGQIDTMVTSCLPAPFFDIDDVVAVTRARIGLDNAPYVIDGLQITARHDQVTPMNLRRVIS